MRNRKILHRIYFADMPPYEDPFLHYLDTWKTEMPSYTIMQWNTSNLPLKTGNTWVQKALADRQPVFLSEYYRWFVLKEYGGIYLDADCEIINGKKLDSLLNELYSTDAYEGFLGIEEKNNGHPTAQTVALKPNADLANFMLMMYDQYLSGPLWHWKESRNFLGPQLITLYFLENGYTKNNGYVIIDQPEIHANIKIYPQEYFSPKFGLTGKTLNYTQNTCVYHLFSNLNINHHADSEYAKEKKQAWRFRELQEYLQTLKIPDADHSHKESFNKLLNLFKKILNKLYNIFPEKSILRKFSSKIFKLSCLLYKKIKFQTIKL